MRVQLGKVARTGIGCVVASVLLVLASCSDDETPSSPTGTSSGTSGTSGAVADSGGQQDGSSSGNPPVDSGTNPADTGSTVDAGPFALSSSAYTNGQTIPTKYECSSNGPGENKSPPLAWSGAPAGTMSYAIVMRDLDFQSGFIHWVMWDIPASSTSLPEDIAHVANPPTPAGSKQAKFNPSIVGYQGPCSPGNVNTYEITVYAMPTSTLAGFTPDNDKATVAAGIVGNAIATAKLAGES